MWQSGPQRGCHQASESAEKGKVVRGHTVYFSLCLCVFYDLHMRGCRGDHFTAPHVCFHLYSCPFLFWKLPCNECHDLQSLLGISRVRLPGEALLTERLRLLHAQVLEGRPSDTYFHRRDAHSLLWPALWTFHRVSISK